MSGGSETGGNQPRDEVPALLRAGECVVTAAALRKRGVEGGGA